ncbi:MAG: DUF937 domain-containing protein [Alphaproteobacteria bacterium]|nr:DUF937 domain-containing protein [Alphaproteobacteria bacterium]MBU1516268.1 DUF937 domain-containing protein [Alphaproteobacteria bacterium]MBU2093108.1 DUF937 domain-containing protein [Alphaproteobacteria bacterium]MBU2151550.1 DUF937 domain-containing protein [Alphaproteobacteria bacterium]MBU2306519.1 DUF937 domain-containing protein [Alphaproteobacteria bacterium]
MGILDNILGAAGGGGAASAITDLLKNQQGGLGGLVQAFEANGLGDLAQSWVGKGENLPISAAQIESVLGSGPIADIASKLGIDPKQAASHLSDLLPQMIDRMTPDGQTPSGALGDLLGKFKL